MGSESDDRGARAGPATEAGAVRLRARSLVVSLREATARLHAAVEALPAMGRLMSEDVGLPDYLGYLIRLSRVYGSLEPPLLAVLDRALAGRSGLRPPVEPKLAAIREDLAALGVTHPAVPAGVVPEDPGAAVGGLYVLEGTILGGQVIARHLHRRLDAKAAQVVGQARFLGFYGEHTSSHWKAFAASLDRLVDLGLVQPESAVAGACQTFERVLSIFSESSA